MLLATLTSVAQEAYVAHGFGERAFHNQTTLHPIGGTALLILAAVTLVVRRRSAMIPLIVLATLVPTAQRVVIATLDFSLLRLLVLVGLSRVLVKNEYSDVRIRRTDVAVIVWCFAGTVAWVLLRGTFSAFVEKAGVVLDMAGAYVLARCWVRDLSDLDRILRCLAWLSIPTFLFFAIEHQTGRNYFSVFGGASAHTMIREGRLRCQGPYVHPILAGSYWAVLIPLLASRWALKRERLLTAASVLAAIGISIFSASSTPILAMLAVVFGRAMFGCRRHMRGIRWCVVGMLVFLHFAREKPVWHLIARVGVVGGSTAYHRYRLVDAAINRFGEWFLVGTKSTAHWGYYLFDVTNQYVMEAVSGGIIGLLTFLFVLGYAFAAIGRTVRMASGNRWMESVTWAVGVSLFAQCCIFMAVTITTAQQNIIVWLLVIAAPTSFDEVWSRARKPVQAARPAAQAPRRPRRLYRVPSPSWQP